jgi:uncharacterized protein YbbK (DUF523 family)
VTSAKEPLLVSACLLGSCTRLDGGHNLSEAVAALAECFCLVPVCPEQLGGLATPRRPAEIQGGAGAEVLRGAARVLTPEGDDVTEAFLRGARAVAAVARLTGATRAVLKARSPSCGVGQTYDGSFSRRLRQGSGVTAQLLADSGLELWTEDDVCGGRGSTSSCASPPDRACVYTGVTGEV